MKKISKVFSLILVLIMLVSVAVMPTSAAEPVVTTGLELVKVTDEDVTVYDTETWEEVAVKASSLTDGDIYKLVVKLSSTKPLLGINIGITYDTSVFTPCWGNEGIKIGVAPTIYGLAVDDENVGEGVSSGSLVSAMPVGQFADTSKYKVDGSIYVSGPPAQYKYNGMFNSSESTSYKVTDTPGAQKDNIVGTGNTGFTGDATDGALMIQHMLSPTTQIKPVKAFKAETLEPVFEIYFKTAKGASVDGARFTVSYISSSTYVGEGDFYALENAVAIPGESAIGCEYVASATETSILQFSKAQIRFRGIGEGGVGTYGGEFDVRTIARISQDDFLATFESDENAIAKISDAGFVYATTSNVAAFDADTAKAVAEGGTAANYVKKSVKHMSHKGDGADYIFTCLIKNIPDADKTDGVSCLAYVCYDGTYYYFDEAVTVSYAGLYDQYFKF